MSRSSQPQETTASTEATPSDGNDNGESGNSQATSNKAIKETLSDKNQEFTSKVWR